MSNINKEQAINNKRTIKFTQKQAALTLQKCRFFILKSLFSFSLLYMMRLKVLVLGNSFVARLGRDISSNKFPSLVPDLCLSQISVFGIQWWVIQGLITDSRDRLRQELLSFPPDLVILQIGGNDIDKEDFDPAAFSKDLDFLTYLLQSHYYIYNIVVYETFPRLKTRTISLSHYENSRVLLNRMANCFSQYATGTSVNIYVWLHSQSITTTKSYFACDGVHLNAAGTLRYFKSLREIVLKFYPSA